MAIIANKVTSEGVVIYIKSDPVIGIVALTSFLDNITGETATEFFTNKLFRYSTNGITFTEWTPLTLPNITSITFQPKDIIVIELSYEKNTSNPSVTVSEVQFTESLGSLVTSDTYFNNSIFAEFFKSTDLEVLKWYINVVEKIYNKGLIANYIERLDDSESVESFLDFWKAIAKYFSFLVIYARKYQKFYEVESLLQEYLEERGLKTSIHNSIVELQYLMENYYKQVFNRGTNHIVDDKFWKGDIIDGELLRLINYIKEDEFLFNLHKNEYFGWNLGNSSPLYRGLYLNDSLQKFDVAQPTKLIKVDERMNYEISFFIQTANAVTVEIEAFDKNQSLVQLKSYKDGSLTNIAIQNVTLQRSDKGIFIRVILYNKSKTIFLNDKTNINQGHDLILNEDVVYIRPKITDNGSIVYPSTLRILPLFTNYSHGLIQVYNFISCWLENNNNDYTIRDIKSYIRQYLIPYNSTLEVVDILRDSLYDDIEIDHIDPSRRLGWRGINATCEYIIDTRPTAWIGDEAYCESDNPNDNYYWIGEETTSECVQI